MSHPLTDYFKSRLEWLGYEDMECAWSLGHCQGDGVAFYGQVRFTKTFLDRIFYFGPAATAADRFKALTERAKWDALSEHFVVNIQCSDSRYTHSGTMRVTSEVDEVEIEHAIESGLIPWVETPSDVWTCINDLISSAEQIVEDDTSAICRLLETEGYDFVGACGLGYQEEKVVYAEQRGGFRATVEVVEGAECFEDTLSCLVGSDSGDDLGFIHSTLSQIRADKLRIADLRATLVMVDEESDETEEVDVHYLGGVTYNPKTRDFGGAERELVNEIFSQYEQLIASSVQAEEAA